MGHEKEKTKFGDTNFIHVFGFSLVFDFSDATANKTSVSETP